ncbi:MAG: hypothetical protein AAF639_43990 [Chloroflexota bacterium]
MTNSTECPSIFLETTIQIDRVLGNRERQLALERELRNYRLVTSRYVLGEYLRTVVKDATRLHEFLLIYPHLDDVLTAVGQHYNKREASRMMLLLGALLRSGNTLEPVTYNQQVLLDRIVRMIKATLVRRFHAGIDELIDDVQCGLARERPVQSTSNPSYQLRSQCVRTVRECALAEHMETWKPQLALLAEGLSESSDPALARMGQLAGRIIDDPVFARGRNCTWHLGDMVIALELPALYNQPPPF